MRIMDNSFDQELDYQFVQNVNRREDAGYSRAQSHLDYYMNTEYVQHPDKCNIYEKSHINSVPMALYSDVVDLESEMINRTRKLSKCSTRHFSPNTQCMSCSHDKKCTTQRCFDEAGVNEKCLNNIVNHTDYASFDLSDL